jgi:hypothetical protein
MAHGPYIDKENETLVLALSTCLQLFVALEDVLENPISTFVLSK